ncbi:hypothetical protein BGX38DRAFT_154568 [Terfezia claveryi]|nr:hypothetical protein BGX38DRAFT_154568 [Terfezia claveryi]
MWALSSKSPMLLLGADVFPVKAQGAMYLQKCMEGKGYGTCRSDRLHNVAVMALWDNYVMPILGVPVVGVMEDVMMEMQEGFGKEASSVGQGRLILAFTAVYVLIYLGRSRDVFKNNTTTPASKLA